ncbi:hypothetical protein [Paraburkholderia sp. J41]|uniref:hypothetical protein n=1 Tax=Paraburkholderia sp. J41 TaxID=2805433 RepID=UPI002AC32896|nr:hypothetical protein [Paraburkholderia sp. J41]
MGGKRVNGGARHEARTTNEVGRAATGFCRRARGAPAPVQFLIDVLSQKAARAAAARALLEARLRELPLAAEGAPGVA